MKSKKLQDYIQAIHQAPIRTCLAIAGGGAEAIGIILKYGNCSATLLDAQVPYHMDAFKEYIGGTPDKFASPEAARDLAMAAYQRATKLRNRQGDGDVIGVGCTATLRKPDGERQGRDHRIYVATQGSKFTTTETLILKGGMDKAKFTLTRIEEEKICAAMVINAIGNVAIGKQMSFGCSKDIVRHHTVPPTIISDLIRHQSDQNNQSTLFFDFREDEPKVSSHFLGNKENYQKFKEETNCPSVIFPGSFNPLHDGHKKMVNVARQLTKQEVAYEISVSNVDKPFLNFTEIENRVKQFAKEKACLLLTKAPKFSQKAKLIENSTFLMGGDTFFRLNDPKYANNLDVMGENLQYNKARLLVFERNGTQSQDQFHIPDSIRKIVEFISSDKYSDSGEESRKIRCPERL